MRSTILRAGKQESGVSSHCLDDHQFKQEELESVGEISQVRSQIAWKYLFAHGTTWKTRYSVDGQQTCDSDHKIDSGMRQTIGKIDFVHSSHMNADSIVMWATLLSIVDCFFQDSDFAGDFEDSTSTSGRVLCIFGGRTFVSISWRCKKQTSVFHSSTEFEIVSLDAGLRMDGLPALDLQDIVIEVLRSTINTARQNKLVQGDLCETGDHSVNKNGIKTST